MEFTELFASFEDIFKTKLNTCIPCKIVNVDEDRVDVRPVYNGGKIGTTKNIQLETGEDAVIDEYELPVIINVPIVMLVNSTARITIPCNVGDEGLLIISQRDINNWKDGKGASLETLRKFNINDGFFLPFINRKIENYSNNSIVIEYKNARIELKDNDIEIKGDISLNGDLTINGDADITGECTIGGIAFSTHTHNVIAVGSPTGVPQ
jgi:phage baseplate assembly protein gpV